MECLDKLTHKTVLRCLLFFILHLLSTTPSLQTTVNLSQVEKSARTIGTFIWNLTEYGTGSKELRKAYQESLKNVTNVDKEQLLNGSAWRIERYFGKKIKSLMRIKEKAGKAYEKLGAGNVRAEEVKYVDMTNINGSTIRVSLVYDEHFKKAVNTSYSGIQIPANVYNKGADVLKTLKWSGEIDEVFRDNLKNKDPTLKWQYFGSHDAVFRTYPAKIWTNPYYSARRRPWYTQGAASPKNVVILIDSSGSMAGKTGFIARLAVSNLIDTFSENDFFNVLYFNTEIRFLSCNRTLVQATKQNRQWFKKKLFNSGYTDAANWEPALSQAFEILKKSNGSNCQKMIMIFSDGAEEKQEKLFKKYNSQTNKVRVFTYLVGTPSHKNDILTWMACSNKGYYYRIPTVGAVRDLIEDYVSVLSRPMAHTKSQHPVWTEVYRDASGLGMMVTGTLPVFYNGTFLGVCGTDVTVEELTNVVYQPHLGADGYCVLVNNNGRVIKHRNLRSMLGYVKNTVDVDFMGAEFVARNEKEKLLNLRKRILSSKDGKIEEEIINAFSFTEHDYYLRATPVQRHYIFTKIKRTPFSVGIASSHFGYVVKQLQDFPVDFEPYNNSGIVFLEDWLHCGNKTLPNKATDQEIRRLLIDGRCSADNLLLDLNITASLENVWTSKKLLMKNSSFAFVKTRLGLLRMSRPISTNIITDDMFQRIRNFKSDFVIVTAPYNQDNVIHDMMCNLIPDSDQETLYVVSHRFLGQSIVQNSPYGRGGSAKHTPSNLLIYKGAKILVSDLNIIPAISGLQIREDDFVKEYLKNVSKDGYQVYLIDENAFIVSSNINSSKAVTGQFLGSVDWELMAGLQNGEEPLYKRFTFRNEQGECPKESSKQSSSSSIRYPFYTSLASVLTSWFNKVFACVLQLNLYNWMFVDATTQSKQQTSVKASTSKTNRSCITNMTTYFGNITNWKSFNGNVSCLDCGEPEEIRQFFVAPVQRTNLVLVVVEHFPEKATFQYTKKKEGVPGQPVEIEIDNSMCQPDFNLFRRPPVRCEMSHDEETRYSCGKAKSLRPNTFTLALLVFYCVVKLAELERNYS